jgi:DNA-binding NtrC family response regulator
VGLGTRLAGASREMAGEMRSDFEEAIGELRLEDLERDARFANGGRALALRDWMVLAEAWRISQALRSARGNRSAAARALGIGRRTLYSKMEKLGLEPLWLVPRNRSRVTDRPENRGDGT